MVLADSSKQLAKVEYSTRPYLSMLILLCVYVRHYYTSVLLVVLLLPPCCHALSVTVVDYPRKKKMEKALEVSHTYIYKI